MSPREWKVFGWIGQRSAAAERRGRASNNQTREIVAARSQAEAARFAGFDSPREMWNLSETGNAVEIAVAMHYQTRGAVCWKPLDVLDPLSWQRDPRRKEAK